MTIISNNYSENISNNINIIEQEIYDFHGKKHPIEEYYDVCGTHKVLGSLVNNYKESLLTVSGDLNKKEYKKAERILKILRKKYTKIENYINFYSFIYLLENTGVSEKNLKKIGKNKLMKNPITSLEKFIYNNSLYNIPIDGGSYIDSLKNAILDSEHRKYNDIKDFCEKLDESKYFVEPFIETKTIKNIINDYNIYSMNIVGNKLKKYQNIDYFLEKNIGLDENIKIELANISSDFKGIMIKLKELLVLKKVIYNSKFSIIEKIQPGTRKKIEKICNCLEKEITKKVDELEKVYNKRFTKLEEKCKVDLSFFKITQINDSMKNELESYYNKIGEAERILNNINNSYNQYLASLSNQVTPMTKNQFEKSQYDTISHYMNKMTIILMKYPELNETKYKINIENKIKYIENNYSMSPVDLQEAFKYKVYKEYILYCSSVKNYNSIISYEAFAKEKYNLNLEVPEEYKFDYKKPEKR